MVSVNQSFFVLFWSVSAAAVSFVFLCVFERCGYEFECLSAMFFCLSGQFLYLSSVLFFLCLSAIVIQIPLCV